MSRLSRGFEQSVPPAPPAPVVLPLLFPFGNLLNCNVLGAVYPFTPTGNCVITDVFFKGFNVQGVSVLPDITVTGKDAGGIQNDIIPRFTLDLPQNKTDKIIKASTCIFRNSKFEIGAGPLSFFAWDYTSILAGTWAKSAGAVSPFDYTFGNDASHANNDRLRYQVYFSQGTYNLVFSAWKGPDCGIIEIFIGGVSIGTFDCYSATDEIEIFRVTGLIMDTSSLYFVELKVSGKNALSTAYYCYPLDFSFQRIYTFATLVYNQYTPAQIAVPALNTIEVTVNKESVSTSYVIDIAMMGFYL